MQSSTLDDSVMSTTTAASREQLARFAEQLLSMRREDVRSQLVRVPRHELEDLTMYMMDVVRGLDGGIDDDTRVGNLSLPRHSAGDDSSDDLRMGRRGACAPLMSSSDLDSSSDRRSTATGGRRKARSKSESRLEVDPLHSDLPLETDELRSSHGQVAVLPLWRPPDSRSTSSATLSAKHDPENATPPVINHEYRTQSGTPAVVALRHLHFYQDYVCERFSDGRSLLSTIDQLMRGEATVETIPPLRVVRSAKGIYYSLCNRRLACYHYVYRDQPDKLIPVLLRTGNEKLLPQGTGRHVRLSSCVMVHGKMMWGFTHCCDPENDGYS